MPDPILLSGGVLALRDNNEAYLEFHYLPWTIKLKRGRNNEEVPRPKNSDPLTYSVSGKAPSWEITVLFNSFGEHHDRSRSSKQISINAEGKSVPRWADGQTYFVLHPELFGVEAVWTVSCMYPLDGVDVIVDDVEEDFSFFNGNFDPRRMYMKMSGRFHYEAPDPETIFRKPKNVAKKAYSCPDPSQDIDLLRSTVKSVFGIDLPPK